MPIERDDRGTRWQVDYDANGALLGQHEALTLNEKAEILRGTFGNDAIQVAEAASITCLNPYRNETPRYRCDWLGKCPDRIHYDQVHNPLSYCREGIDAPHRLFIDLGSIGRGKDAYDQTDYVYYSNYRSLLRDYPNVFTVISYSNVDTLGAYIGNLPEYVIDILCGLRNDYPLYDESDCSELECELVSESWQYTDYDLARWLEEYAPEYRDLWDALEDVPAPDPYVSEGQSMREYLWWEVNSENQGNPWHEMELMTVIWRLDGPDGAGPAYAQALDRYFATEPQPAGQEMLPGLAEGELKS